MKVTDTQIPDVKLIEPTVFEDDRGFFFESFNQKTYQDAIGQAFNFIQDNHSQSFKGVLRGLHYQLNPYAQSKLVRVIKGEVYDVAVDIRKNSPTFGNWIAEILNEKNKKQLFIPKGFAHGYLTLSDTAQLLYKVDNIYEPSFERCILWNDQIINIKWPIEIEPKLSKKDINGFKLLDSDL